MLLVSRFILHKIRSDIPTISHKRLYVNKVTVLLFCFCSVFVLFLFCFCSVFVLFLFCFCSVVFWPFSCDCILLSLAPFFCFLQSA